ncbi:MAG: hypothetical protein ACE15C_21080 [Phycisphaerae bacterium]
MSKMRIAVIGTLALALLGMPPVTATAAEDKVSNDFTKDMGKWKLDKAEGKTGEDGLKITKVEKFGGIGIETGTHDLSDATAITIELKNAGDKELAMTFRIRSKDSKADDEFKVAAGKSVTHTFKLAGREVDLKKITLLRLYAADAGETNLIVKKITVVKAETASKPASEPAAK